jgi:TonB family protein
MPLHKHLPWIGSILVHSFIVAIPLNLRDLGGFYPPGRALDFSFEQPSQGPAQETSVASAVPAAKAPPAIISAPEGRPRDDEDEVQPDRADPLDAMLDEDVGSVSDYSSAGSAENRISAEIGWESEVRSLIRRQALAFPKVLSAAGQETDCDARITVSALGTVTKVEIVKSSGYTEIDASVQSALSGYVFTRNYDSEKKEAIGIVRFRFRLEKLD